MRRFAILGSLAALVLAGALAARVVAGVSPSPGDGATVSVGQSLVYAVSDSFSGDLLPGVPAASCSSNLDSQASGWLAVGPLGPGHGGSTVNLAVSCSATNTWTYSGSITVTVPENAPDPVWASVSVHEVIPITTGSNHTNDYSANYHYPLATSSATTTSTSPSTTIAATSTGATTTTPVTAPGPTTTVVSPTTTATQSATTTVTVVKTTTVASTATTAPGLTTTRAKPLSIGKTVLLKTRTRSRHCKLGAEPDRRCSPGAYYSGLTKAVLCSPTSRAGRIRNVPDSEKRAVEAEYGITPGSYGSTLEIDRIVSLDLGGSNDIANLFPEKATIAGRAGYHAKDKLENRLHTLVCSGAMTLTAAQRAIASNWEVLYTGVFGVQPPR